MNVRLTARWVLPIASPLLEDGWVDVDPSRDAILGVGTRATLNDAHPGRVIDLGAVVILPGLVNAHTHLELSHLAGAVPPAPCFVAWVRAMLAARAGIASTAPGDRGALPVDASSVTAAIARAIDTMTATGTAVVGDIGNTDAAVRPLAASALAGVYFREALGFRSAHADRLLDDARRDAERANAVFRAAGRGDLVASIAPHAPYSTSPPLLAGLAGGMDAERAVSSVHLGESPEEVEFLQTGRGPFRDLLDDLGAWDETWTPPGIRPAAYVQQCGALHDRLLVVHGTQFDDDDLALVARARATLVSCVRSNRWVGAGAPPVAEALAAGVRLAVGTDSLASVEDLNLFAELAALRDVAPGVPAGHLLYAATRGGALALGCDRFGYLGPGATTRALVRTPPAGVTDVEEWLVSGAAETSDLRWLDALVTHAA